MFENVGREDQRMMFLGCIVLIKNKLVYVHAIADKGWTVETLRDNKTHVIPNPLKDVSPPYARLGMVNTPGGAVFVQRTPQRVYRVGYSMENIHVKKVPLGCGMGVLNDFKINSRYVYDCLKNNYPSLEEAYAMSKVMELPVAFDKQFAINHEGAVCFKASRIVGVISDNYKEVNFLPSEEYLQLLLGDINDKNLRDSQ